MDQSKTRMLAEAGVAIAIAQVLMKERENRNN